MNRLRLGVNVDHVATLRNARGGPHPDPVAAARIAVAAGADGITAHLREDRRHIRDADLTALRALPILWAEPTTAGRPVTRDDAVGLCSAAANEAAREGDALLAPGGGLGRCAALPGTWRVMRDVADRCIGERSAWYMDPQGRRHPARSCRVEAHVVEVAGDGGNRYALIATNEDDQE